MSTKTKRDASTAAVGLTGVAGGAAARHHALERVYEEKGPHPIKRPRLFAERRFLKHPKGRKAYIAAATAGLLGTPAAAVGANGLLNKRSALSEGFSGATGAFNDRTDSMRDKPPRKLVAGNYLTSLGTGSAVTGVTHAALSRHKRFPGGARSALAATGGVVAGAAALPTQAKATEMLSRGKYTATPTGVRRVKTKPVRPSKKATIIEGRNVDRGAFRRQSVGKADTKPRTKGDPGANMTRVQRRAAILASGPPIPVVGDVLQASMAARLAPKGDRVKTGAQQYGANQVGGLTGNAVGAAGALALARKSPSFDRKATAADAAINHVKDKAKAVVGLKPTEGPSAIARSLAKTPRLQGAVRRIAHSPVGRAIAAKPAVAAVGALAGGTIGATAASNANITHQLNRDDKRRASMAKRDSLNGHGSRISKAEPKALSHREDEQLRRRKKHSAALSALTGSMGLGAFGATVAAPALRRPKVVARVKHAAVTADKLDRAKVPLLTTAAGIGGYNGIQFARVQRKEAASKALGLPRVLRPTGMPRRPAAARGYVAQRRGAGGTINTYSARGRLA